MSTIQIKKATRLMPVVMILLLAFATLALAQGGRYQVDPWSFGVHGDTQWYVGGDYNEENPDWVSAGIASAINEQFIAYKDIGKYDVKFVLQVGDLTDRAGNDAMYTRAMVSQPLYDAGIGFFPLRGNHETFESFYFPDTFSLDMNIPAYLDAFPQTQGLANTFGATDFSSPSDVMPDVDVLDGLSYSFDYDDATFVIVDVEATSYWLKEPVPHPVYGDGFDWPVGPGLSPFWVLYTHTEDLNDGAIPAGTWFRINSSGNPSTNFYGWDGFWPPDSFTAPQQPKWVSEGTTFWPGDQQDWISVELDKTTRGTEHAFVFSHRGLMGADHVDCFFGSNPGSKASTQNPFYASLMNNDVKYMISGHDHIHNRALVDSPDGLSQVEQLITIGASNKFYDPAPLNDFIGYYGDVKQRETIISQETWTVGYYVYTVDGPRVTVDYYSDSEGFSFDGDDYPYGPDGIPAPGGTPDFDFVKKETWGYGQNGQQFLIAQGDSYTIVKDRFHGTKAKILNGTNNSTTTDYTPVDFDDDVQVSGPRPLNKTVNTGWVSRTVDKHKLISDILSLWGMAELGTDETDVYVLSMSHDFRKAVRNGTAGIATIKPDSDNEWINAVDLNIGTENNKNFIDGPYMEGYPLGTYGIDKKTKTVWAVLNYNADFAVVKDITPVQSQEKAKKRNKKGK